MFLGIHETPARRFSSLLSVCAYDAQPWKHLQQDTHLCACLCGLRAGVSRQYLLSNVCSLVKAQKPSVSDVAAESLSDGSRVLSVSAALHYLWDPEAEAKLP